MYQRKLDMFTCTSVRIIVWTAYYCGNAKCGNFPRLCHIEWKSCNNVRNGHFIWSVCYSVRIVLLGPKRGLYGIPSTDQLDFFVPRVDRPNPINEIVWPCTCLTCFNKLNWSMFREIFIDSEAGEYSIENKALKSQLRACHVFHFQTSNIICMWI